MKTEDLLTLFANGKLTELSRPGIELKSRWDQACGKDISALANDLSFEDGWLIVGVDDKGQIVEQQTDWAKQQESLICNHLMQYLQPSWAVHSVSCHEHDGRRLILINVKNPGDVVYWNHKAYVHPRRGVPCYVPSLPQLPLRVSSLPRYRPVLR